MFCFFNRKYVQICACHPVLGCGCLRREVLKKERKTERREVPQPYANIYYLSMAFDCVGGYMHLYSNSVYF